MRHYAGHSCRLPDKNCSEAALTRTAEGTHNEKKQTMPSMQEENQRMTAAALIQHHAQSANLQQRLAITGTASDGKSQCSSIGPSLHGFIARPDFPDRVLLTYELVDNIAPSVHHCVTSPFAVSCRSALWKLFGRLGLRCTLLYQARLQGAR